MKVLMINVVCGIRSTGRICTDLAVALEQQGHEVKIAYGRESVPRCLKKYAVRIGTELDTKMHGVTARLLDGAGFGSKRVTENFIKWVKLYNPDVIHLHNIHGYYINVEVLFKYLKSCGKKIIWTLHDCWSFTGHCTYFDYAGCELWKTGCERCPQIKEYPKSYIDRSTENWNKKKNLFSDIPNMTIVTPSKWLAGLVEKSYLKDYPIDVIYNGIDTELFKPTYGRIKEKYNCQDRKVVLGVAAIWDKRKGLESFIKLAGVIDESYQIILVGLNKEQITKLPKNIIGIERTNSVQELAELYTAADVFINPTIEDNYPTTNIEAIACGTPVITYKTGGSVESASMYGTIVEKDDIAGIMEAIKSVKEIKPNNIDINYRHTIQKYLKLYEGR